MRPLETDTFNAGYQKGMIDTEAELGHKLDQLTENFNALREMYAEAYEENEALKAAAREAIEKLYTALDVLNRHHAEVHHQNDPDMPVSLLVAEGYFAYRKWSAAQKRLVGEEGADQRYVFAGTPDEVAQQIRGLGEDPEP